MKKKSSVFLLLIAGAMSPFSARAATPIADALVKPTSAWTGTLILPAESARRPDGGVLIQLKNSPNPDLRGKTVWMSYGDPTSSLEAREFYRQFLDVNFTQQALTDYNQNHFFLDIAVNGWKAVSPLESLAAAPHVGQTDVALETPTWDGSRLIIHSEPILISGHEMIYIRFNHTLPGNEFEVTHYDPASNSFSGATSTVRVLLPADAYSWDGIENFPQNPQGWLAFGNREVDGTFDIGSVEPTSLFSSTTGFQEIQDQNQVLPFFNEKHWNLKNPALQGQERKTAIELGGTTLPQMMTLGTKFLVIHTFGSGKSMNPVSVGPLKFYPGHFAYGIAQVVPHPFTGQPKIDLVYNQIYASNAYGVIAGRHAYHHYANDPARQVAMVRPFSDVLVPMPELFHAYNLADQTIEPERLIQTQFSLMQGWYRIGAGSGESIVESYTSCVQDSSQVLLNGIWTLKQMTKQEPIKSWMKNNPKNPEVSLFKDLMTWAQRANDKLGGNGNFFDLITGLQSHTYLPAALRNPSNVNPLEYVMLTFRAFTTAFPRSTQDHLIEAALELRRSMILLDTFDTFNHTPAFAPIEPQIPIGISYVNPTGFPDSCSTNSDDPVTSYYGQ